MVERKLQINFEWWKILIEFDKLIEIKKTKIHSSRIFH